MENPTQITFRGLPPSEAVESNIHKHVERLQRLHPDISACHVTVELPHQHHQHGNHYRVQVEVSVAGGKLQVTCGDSADHAYEDAYVVVRDAFNAATRRLDDRAQRSRAQRRPAPAASKRSA